MKRGSSSTCRPRKKTKLEPRADLGRMLHDLFPLILSFLDPRDDVQSLTRCMQVNHHFHSLIAARLYTRLRIADGSMRPEHYQSLLRGYLRDLHPTKTQALAARSTSSPLQLLRHLTISAVDRPSRMTDIGDIISKRRMFAPRSNVPVLPTLVFTDITEHGDMWVTAFSKLYIPFTVHKLVLHLGSMEHSSRPRCPLIPDRLTSTLRQLVLVQPCDSISPLIFDLSPAEDKIHIDSLTDIKLVLLPDDCKNICLHHWMSRSNRILAQLGKVFEWTRRAAKLPAPVPSITVIGLAEVLDAVSMDINQGAGPQPRHDYETTITALKQEAAKALVVGKRRKLRKALRPVEVEFQSYAEFIQSDGQDEEMTRADKERLLAPSKRWEEYLESKVKEEAGVP